MSQSLLALWSEQMNNKSKGDICQGRNICFYKRYNMTGAGLRRGRVETVGVLCSGASSFAAPLKVNKELSNVPMMLIKKRKKKRMTAALLQFPQNPFFAFGCHCP